MCHINLNLWLQKTCDIWEYDDYYSSLDGAFVSFLNTKSSSPNSLKLHGKNIILFCEQK